MPYYRPATMRSAGLRGKKVNALKLKPSYNYLGIAAGWSRCDNQPIPGPEASDRSGLMGTVRDTHPGIEAISWRRPRHTGQMRKMPAWARVLTPGRRLRPIWVKRTEP